MFYEHPAGLGLTEPPFWLPFLRQSPTKSSRFRCLDEDLRQRTEKTRWMDTVTSLEHEYLRQRLALVEEWLENPDRAFEYAGHGRVRRRGAPAERRDVDHEREARLLRKLQRRASEGCVLSTLTVWREQLGKFLWDHRQCHKEMQDVYDAWRELPLYQRENTPQPPQPPPARYVDKEGESWIVDDRFLALLDALAGRMRIWKHGEDE